MTDPRHVKLARVLVDYSLRIQQGDKLLIVASPLAAPVLRAVYRTALRAGAHITTRTLDDDLLEIKLREASEEQLGYLSPLDLEEINHCDARLVLLAEENTKLLASIKPERMAMYQQARHPYLQRQMERAATADLRWCVTTLPTQAYAQDASMSLAEFEDFVYNAGLLNEDDPVSAWRNVHVEQQRIADFLMAHDEIRIVAPDTDITYRVGGRTWINASGERNFPDGEVFTGPIENSVNGTVRFSYPAVYYGTEVEDVRLTFKDGRVVMATAGRGVEFLHAMLDQDDGARVLGEVAFGLNYGIQRFSRNIGFDEKIGGTMHMALGASYPDTGGVNVSGLHWDMVCDLREGKVYADGKLCFANGKFTV